MARCDGGAEEQSAVGAGEEEKWRSRGGVEVKRRCGGEEEMWRRRCGADGGPQLMTHLDGAAGTCRTAGLRGDGHSQIIKLNSVCFIYNIKSQHK